MSTRVIIRLQTASRSATGTRQRNEDRLLVRELAAGTVLLAVADGMGGEAAGDIAAQLAIDTLAELAPASGAEEARLEAQINTANDRILTEAARRGLQGMGTTLTAALIAGNDLVWAHVGDSRLYLFRAGELRQLTLDHNAAGRLVASGRLTPEEARVSPLRHLLDQCVGCRRCLPDSGRLSLQAGDRLLLATDGLHGELADEAIASGLAEVDDLERTARILVDAALARGGRDNVTVVLAAL